MELCCQDWGLQANWSRSANNIFLLKKEKSLAGSLYTEFIRFLIWKDINYSLANTRGGKLLFYYNGQSLFLLNIKLLKIDKLSIKYLASDLTWEPTRNCFSPTFDSPGDKLFFLHLLPTGGLGSELGGEYSLMELWVEQGRGEVRSNAVMSLSCIIWQAETADMTEARWGQCLPDKSD